MLTIADVILWELATREHHKNGESSPFFARRPRRERDSLAGLLGGVIDVGCVQRFP